jgi:hypothetical protein
MRHAEQRSVCARFYYSTYIREGPLLHSDSSAVCSCSVQSSEQPLTIYDDSRAPCFSPSHYGLNHAFLRHIMLGKKGGNDDRKDDSPWCCSPVLTAPKLGKRSYLTFSTAISTARRHGSSGVCDVANRLSPLKVRRHFRQGSMCSQICRGRR